MNKEDYLNRIVCEYWFGFISWKGKEGDDKKKSIWLSGMHRAWNILQPSEKIEALEVHIKKKTWAREEAKQWYADYLSEEEKDDGSIKDRYEILDLRKPSSIES